MPQHRVTNKPPWPYVCSIFFLSSMFFYIGLSLRLKNIAEVIRAKVRKICQITFFISVKGENRLLKYAQIQLTAKDYDAS